MLPVWVFPGRANFTPQLPYFLIHLGWTADSGPLGKATFYTGPYGPGGESIPLSIGNPNPVLTSLIPYWTPQCGQHYVPTTEALTLGPIWKTLSKY